MRRAVRLFEIIQVLRRARRPISAQKLADELEVSKRSVYRDIAALVAQRVPIRGEPGVGYILERGFDMPPLMLTEDEMDAAVLGALWVAERGEPELARAAKNLLAKIGASTPTRLRMRARNPAVSVKPSDPQPEVPHSDDGHAAMLRHAIHAGTKVSLQYIDGGGAVTIRVVWPVLLG